MKNNGNESHNQHNTGSVHERAPTFSKEELARQQTVFCELYNNMQSLLTESPYAEMESVRGINSDYVANTTEETDDEKTKQLVAFEKSGLVYVPGNLYRITEHEGPDGPAYVHIEYIMPTVSKIPERHPRSERIQISRGDYGLYTAKRQLIYAYRSESMPLSSEEAVELNVQFNNARFVSSEEYEARLKELATQDRPEEVASKGLVKLLKRKLEKHK